jgi:hypothetical protein
MTLSESPKSEEHGGLRLSAKPVEFIDMSEWTPFVARRYVDFKSTCSAICC